MEKNNAQKILKTAMLIYLASFLIINWADVSWVFNYRTVSGLVSDFFNPYPSIDASTMNAYFYPNHSQPTIESTTIQPTAQPIKDIKTTYTDKQNILEIPKISISVPIIFSTTTDNNALKKDLDKGVVFYPGSVYPGQIGQMVILGHSAPPGWPMIKHDWVFTDLNDLSIGDEVFVHLNNQQYKYIVKQKKIIQKGADIPVDESAINNNFLTLISCWPPGKNYQRITVQAELQNN
ncbi:MAG: sortase [Candidatus Staskawiczbacteria bacterium]|jgi:sortase A